MSYLLPHLHTGFAVDQAILSVSGVLEHMHMCLHMTLWPTEASGEALAAFSAPCLWALDKQPVLPSRTMQEESRVVVIRFGHDWDETCMQMDEASGVVGAAGCLALLRATDPCVRLPRGLAASLGSSPALFLQVLASTVERMKNFAVIYLVDISEVPDFSAMYELYDACTIMFFFRNKVGQRTEESANWSNAGRQGRARS